MASKVILNELMICNMLWDALLKSIFGAESVQRIERFGHYVAQRCQLVYGRLLQD